jgi:hypothetical protein
VGSTRRRHRINGIVLLCGLIAPLSSALTAEAAGRNIKNSTRTSVNTSVNGHGQAASGLPVTVIGTDRSVDLDVDVDEGRGPARAAVVTSDTIVAETAVGRIVRTLPPGCSATVVADIGYQNCSGTWYQPQYAGMTLQYLVVRPPK